MKSFGSTCFENPSLYLVLRDNILVKESNMNANGRNNFCIQHLCCLHKSRKKFYNTMWFISLQLHRILHKSINSSTDSLKVLNCHKIRHISKTFLKKYF